MTTSQQLGSHPACTQADYSTLEYAPWLGNEFVPSLLCHEEMQYNHLVYQSGSQKDDRQPQLRLLHREEKSCLCPGVVYRLLLEFYKHAVC